MTRGPGPAASAVLGARSAAAHERRSIRLDPAQDRVEPANELRVDPLGLRGSAVGGADQEAEAEQRGPARAAAALVGQPFRRRDEDRADALHVALFARAREALRRPTAADPNLARGGGERGPQLTRPLEAPRRDLPARLIAAADGRHRRNRACNADRERTRYAPFRACDSLQILCLVPQWTAPCSHRFTGNGLPGEEQR